MKKILPLLLSFPLLFTKNSLAQYSLTDSLIAYYPFNGNANDETGHGHDGTVSGASLVSDRFGYANSAYSFNGSGDYISLDAGDHFQPNTFPMSVSMWIKSNSSDYTTGLFLNDYTPDVYTGIIFEVNPGNGGVLIASFGDGGTNSSGYRRSKIGTIWVNDNQWHFVACVIRGATDMDLYVDCNYDPGYYDGGGGSMSYSNNDGRLGMRDETSGNYHYKGVMDDIRFYHRELTQGDLQVLYYNPQPYGNTPFTVSLGGDTALCPGSTLVLAPTITNGVAQSYLWSDGSTDSTLTVDHDGEYWVEVSDGCGIVSDTILIGKGFLNPVNLGPDTIMCDGQYLTLDAGPSYSSYLWSNGAFTQSIIVNTQGIYSVTVTGGGCASTDSIQVSYILCSGIENIESGSGLHAFFDKDENVLTLWSENLGMTNAEIFLYDAMGRLIRQDGFTISSDPSKFYFESTLTPGFYLARIQTKNSSLNLPLLVSH